MATFVLLHGGWHGGWCWRPVEAALRALGHEVLRPTFSGMGERVHLDPRGIDLHTHVDDIVNVLRFEDLRDVVLVGHSYAGRVLPGIADAVPERLAHLVWFDAIVAFPGDHVKADDGAGPFTAPRGPADRGEMRIGDDLDDDAVRWWDERLTGQPTGTLVQPNPWDARQVTLRATFVRCTRARLPKIDLSYERASALGWPVVELDGGHLVMLSSPDLTARALAALA